MKLNQMYPSRYLKAGDFPTPMTLTIKETAMEKMKQEDGSDVVKPVIYFQEFPKGFVLNKTNGEVLSRLYGDESDNWSGNRITLIIVQVSAYGKIIDSLRFDNNTPPPSQPRKQAEKPVPPNFEDINALFGDSDVIPR